MQSLTDFATAKLQDLEERRLRRSLRSTHRLDAVEVDRDGQRFVSFSCNDYLGLSHHPAVKAAAVAAVEAFGVGAGASRLITGDHPLLGRLEGRLAALKGAEASCVFGSGYLANAGIIPSFVGPGDHVFLDELAHACLWAGARLSGATVVSFRHNDAADLAEKLASRDGQGRALVGTDGVFSMDGDVAPLDQISSACIDHGAWLLVDDAHGLGVLGERGAGSGALFPTAHIDLAMGTLSKALGGYGAYVCGAQPVIDLITTRARTFIYTTGLPPACAAGALAALDVMTTEPERLTTPLDRARRFTGALGLPTAQSPIVPLLLGDAGMALRAAADLEKQGLLAVAIRPPTVPPGTARLRLAFSALHTEAQVDRLVEAVRPWVAA